MAFSSQAPTGLCETHPCVGELAHAIRTLGTGLPALQVEACLWRWSICVTVHEGLCAFLKCLEKDEKILRADFGNEESTVPKDAHQASM